MNESSNMADSPPQEATYLADLCRRAFPHRDDQYVTAVEYIGAWQHEMTAFTLGWRDGDQWLTEPLIMRRYKSQLSWWQVADAGKAEREATVIHWLQEEGLPVPNVHVMEQGARGDVLVERRLPGLIWFDIDHTFARAIDPYVELYAQLLAKVHNMEVPFAVQSVVPHVTILNVLDTLRGWANHAKDTNLLSVIDLVAAEAENVEEVAPALLHGDYHFANVLLDDGTISGIIDWEFAAYGDPRWDVVAAYQLLVEFDASSAADRFLNTYIAESNRNFDGPPLWNVVVPLQAWALSAWLRAEVISGRTFDFRMAEVLGDQYDEREARAIEALALLG